MATTLTQKGQMVPFTNSTGSTLASGAPVDLGWCMGIVQNTTLNGADGIACVYGVHKVAKNTSDAFAQGQTVFWDATAGEAVDNGGALNVNKLMGVAFEAAGASATTLQVKLLERRPSGEGVLSLLAKDFRVHDAIQTALPTTAADDDLALIAGTFGTDTPTIQGVDFGGTSTTAYARIQVPIPADYQPGGRLTLRANAGMLTSVADTSCTLDAQVYAADRSGAASADLCATAAQSMNSLTKADLDFTITATGRQAGDVLDIRLTVAGTDSANAAIMLPEISAVELIYAPNP